MKPENYDPSLIRPPVYTNDIQHRGRDFLPDKRKKVIKTLRQLHMLEVMAANIYRMQITKEPSELNRELIAAMHNEMTHIQDFRTKLMEYGAHPAFYAFVFWWVGFVMGLGSRILGKKAILKAGIWVESKAVTDYGKILESLDWDEPTRAVIAKDRADEEIHIDRWKNLLDR